MQATHPYFSESYSFYNFPATRQLLKLGELVRSDLNTITCPTLSCLTAEDLAIDPYGVSDLLSNVPAIEIKWFPGEHSMTVNNHADEVKAAIINFYKKLL